MSLIYPNENAFVEHQRAVENALGFGRALKIKLLHELIQKEDIDFVSIQETILPGDDSGIVKCLWSHRDFSFCFVQSVGRSGCLLSTWKSESFTTTS